MKNAKSPSRRKLIGRRFIFNFQFGYNGARYDDVEASPKAEEDRLPKTHEYSKSYEQWLGRERKEQKRISGMKRFIFALFLLVTAANADITVTGDKLHVEAAAYTALFDRGTITQFHNKLTGETYTLAPGTHPGLGQQAAVLGGQDFWARYASEIQIKQFDAFRADIIFRRDGNEIRLSIAVDPSNNDLVIGGEGVSAMPGVRGIQWCIENLDIHNLSLILPSERIQYIDASSAIEDHTFRYPTYHWQAQLAIVESRFGGFYVRGTDATFKFKELYYKSNAAQFGLTFRTMNQAPWDSLTSAKSVTWRLNAYAGEWCVPAQIHRDWMEQAFNPRHLTDAPAWVNDIGLTVIHARLETKMLERLAQYVEPLQTLLYLTEWRKYPHDVMMPDYTSVRDDFEMFLKVARRYGYRIMLHTNLHGISTEHPVYPEFQQDRLRYPGGGLSGWRLDEIGHPKRNEHISLGNSRWRNLLIRQFKALRDKYAIDAFHLDVSHHIVNNAHGLVEGLTSAEASVLMHNELMEAMPDVVFSGEFLHEVTFAHESFAQRYASEHAPHPVSAFLFAPYTRLTGHLGFPSEYQPERLRNALDSYERQGIIPTARLLEGVLTRPITQEIFAIARQWQALKLMPDPGCDWNENALFQYITTDGDIVTHQHLDGLYSFNTPGDGGYLRVHGVTQVETDWSLPEWRAYNDKMILGLDANKTYLLDNSTRDFSRLRINALSPEVYVVDTRVTSQAALFQLASTSPLKTTPVGMFLPIPPIATVPDPFRSMGAGHYSLETDPSRAIVVILSAAPIRLPHNLRNAQFITGLQQDGFFRIESVHGSGDRRTATIDGVHKETIFAHPPKFDAETILQFTLTLPDTPSTLSYAMGIDGERSQGVRFQVRLNGQTKVDLLKETFDWTEGSLSLGGYAGRPVMLEFVTDPGDYGGSGADFDWAHWADLFIMPDKSSADVNGDGVVNILDLVRVASNLGKSGENGADVNRDGIVNILDLVRVAGAFGNVAAAPSSDPRMLELLTATDVEQWLAQAQTLDLTDATSQRGVLFLKQLLTALTPKETMLLPNYPNPFNPETWIPYQLTKDADVTLTIYDTGGIIVRRLDIGHWSAGYYAERGRAAYWDGCNDFGEKVASGVYFYHLSAGNYSAARKMLIQK